MLDAASKFSFSVLRGQHLRGAGLIFSLSISLYQRIVQKNDRLYPAGQTTGKYLSTKLTFSEKRRHSWSWPQSLLKETLVLQNLWTVRSTKWRVRMILHHLHYRLPLWSIPNPEGQCRVLQVF